MKSRHPENTLDLPIRMDRIDMASEAGNLAISSHNNSDPRRIHKSGIFKIKHYIFHIFPDQKPVCPFTDIGGSVVIHFLRKSDDAQNAITTYDKIIELFPETETARSAQRYRSQLAENTAQ